MYGDGSHTHLTDDGRPLPRITPLNEKFWALARQSVFSLQTCSACGHQHVPESPVCPQCLGTEQGWVAASGDGVLESWVDFHRAYWDGFKDHLPYRVCLVRLKEGPLFVSNLTIDTRELHAGLPVRVVFTKVTEEITLPRFALV